MTPVWLTAFVDFPADTYDAGTAFWSRVTGYALSPSRGDHDQFATLVSSPGHDFLRVQRLDDGPARLHLDLHVEDVAAAVAEAEGIGAVAVGSPYDDVSVMRSPGGLVFCFVTEPGGDRPPPTTWPGGNTSYVDQVCLDIPPSRYAAEVDFWHRLTGWRRRDPEPGSEFDRLTPGVEQPLQLLLQRLDDEQDVVTAHLDWAASDHEAELAAHVAAGAELVARHEGWTVLRDPAGLAYCVTRRYPGRRP